MNECEEKLVVPVKLSEPVLEPYELLEKEPVVEEESINPVSEQSPQIQQNNQQEQVPLNFVPNHPQVVRQSADTIQCVNLFQGPECEFVSNENFSILK